MNLIDTIPQADKPQVHIETEGETGNAYFIIGQVVEAWMKLNRMDIIDEYMGQVVKLPYEKGVDLAKKYTHPSTELIEYDASEVLVMHMFGAKLVHTYGNIEWITMLTTSEDVAETLRMWFDESAEQ